MSMQSATEIRNVIPESAIRRSTALGVSLVGLTVAAYLGCFAALLLNESILWKAVASSGIALSVCILFVLGHDACHGSLTPRATLNKALGRLCLLANLHPYTAWEWTHNGKHHGWTNVRGKDIVYCPFSPDDFAKLPAWRRAAERLFRSPLGLGPLYFFTVYLPYEMFADGSRRPPGRRASLFRLDRILVVLFLVMQLGVLIWAAWPAPGTVAANLLLGFFLPQIIFQYTMGFVTYLHHTHPNVPWYRDEKEFTFFRSQVASTAHIEFPWIIEVVLHHILKHTAHHIDPRIPLYNLPEAQAAIESNFDEVVHEPFTLRGFVRTVNSCKLYDYDKHVWLAFDGTPTSAPHRLVPATGE